MRWEPDVVIAYDVQAFTARSGHTSRKCMLFILWAKAREVDWGFVRKSLTLDQWSKEQVEVCAEVTRMYRVFWLMVKRRT